MEEIEGEGEEAKKRRRHCLNLKLVVLVTALAPAPRACGIVGCGDLIIGSGEWQAQVPRGR